jgi:hypothetical protein
MNTVKIEESLIDADEKQYICKLFECKNFKYPFIEILKNEKNNEYFINFLNENYNTEKITVYNNNIPKAILKLFDLKYEESIIGLLTEITCIQCIDT